MESRYALHIYTLHLICAQTGHAKDEGTTTRGQTPFPLTLIPAQTGSSARGSAPLSPFCTPAPTYAQTDRQTRDDTGTSPPPPFLHPHTHGTRKVRSPSFLPHAPAQRSTGHHAHARVSKEAGVLSPPVPQPPPPPSLALGWGRQGRRLLGRGRRYHRASLACPGVRDVMGGGASVCEGTRERAAPHAASPAKPRRHLGTPRHRGAQVPLPARSPPHCPGTRTTTARKSRNPTPP